MRKIVAMALLGTFFVSASAFAGDAVIGSWKLNRVMSKFSGTAPKSITRVYTERMLATAGIKPGEFDMVFAGATSARRAFPSRFCYT